MVAEEAATMQTRESAYQAYAEERKARLKQERITQARKIAPGFLDNEDRRILTPTLASAQVAPQRSSSSSSSSNTKAANQFDYSEFETRDTLTDDLSHQPMSQDEETLPSSTSAESRQKQRDSPSIEVSQSLVQEEGVDENRDGTEEEVIVQAKSTMPTFNTRLDYREFEQGLGPPDPWETPVDDMTALKDVISRQMGHSNASHISQQDSSLQNGNVNRGYSQQPHHPSLSQQHHQHQHQHQHQQQHSSYPYHQTQNSSQSYMAADPSHAQYMFASSSNMPRTGGGNNQQYNSSPNPVAAYVDQKQQHQGLGNISQQHHHQPQHSHSAGSLGGHASTVTGLSASQQHTRFGKASPSPPPLPPPPRAMTSSPSGKGTSSLTTAMSRPPLPARPGRPTDTESQPTPSTTPDHVTMNVTDRSMTPTRPPLPPPPLLASSMSGQSTTLGNRPMLKPKPPKEYGMNGGSNEASDMDRGLSGGGSGNEDVQQAAHLAPPEANELIERVASMGFTREQSREALEKYDYDPTKALNHLLDWG
ncbi:hypothetical protein BGZ94_009154 [Podila epigama]|nr:hypothetical protein BGZ94_009154 [Podila epigama]